MPKNLTGNIALVTGGSRGIGAAIVKRLASEGADVALTYVSNPDRADETAKAARALGVRALAIRPFAHRPRDPSPSTSNKRRANRLGKPSLSDHPISGNFAAGFCQEG